MLNEQEELEIKLQEVVQETRAMTVSIQVGGEVKVVIQDAEQERQRPLHLDGRTLRL